MLPLNISQADVLQANIERKKHKSTIVRDRMHALYLLYEGYSRQACAHILGRRPNTITAYIRLYNERGLDGLRQLQHYRPTSELSEHQESLKEDLRRLKPRTISEIKQFILDKYGIEKSLECIRVFMHSIGFSYRKVGAFPGGKNVEQWLVQQAEFLKTVLNPLINKALNREIDLLFCDAAHFVQGKFDTYLWSEQSVYAPSSSGRYRVNVLGGLDIVNDIVLSMYNDQYINAQTLVNYFNWLRKEHYPNQKRPLHLVLDNARYQKCDLVTQEANHLNIKLIYLPPYSPNLNLIERLWKWMKKKLARGFYPNKQAFMNAIVDLLNFINSGKGFMEIENLFNIKFQSFENSRLVTW